MMSQHSTLAAILHVVSDAITGLALLGLSAYFIIIATRHIKETRPLITWIGITLALIGANRISACALWLGADPLSLGIAKAISTVFAIISLIIAVIKVPRLMRIPHFGEWKPIIEKLRTEIAYLTVRLAEQPPKAEVSAQLRDVIESVSQIPNGVTVDD